MSLGYRARPIPPAKGTKQVSVGPERISALSFGELGSGAVITDRKSNVHSAATAETLEAEIETEAANKCPDPGDRPSGLPGSPRALRRRLRRARRRKNGAFSPTPSPALRRHFPLYGLRPQRPRKCPVTAPKGSSPRLLCSLS